MSENFIVRILKKPDVTDLAGEKVMIDFDSGKYFMLTGSANDIWSMLVDGMSSVGIISELMDIYEVEEAVCRDSVLAFLNKLSEIGFIRMDECV